MALIVDYPRCWQINAYCSVHIIATPAFVVSDSSRLIAALSSVPVVFSGWLSAGCWLSRLHQLSTNPPLAISIYNSDPKHTVPFPVLDTIYTTACIQMWTLEMDSPSRCLSLHPSLASLFLSITVSLTWLFFSCRSGWSNLKRRMTKRVDVGKGGVGVQRLRIIQECKTFSKQKTLRVLV